MMNHLKKVRDAYAKLLKRLRGYRDELAGDQPWCELRELYLNEDFEDLLWSDEQRVVIQDEVRAILAGLVLSERISESEFFALAERFAKLRKLAEVGIFNDFAKKEGVPGDLLKLVEDGSIEVDVEPLAELN